jgi:thiol-disulfide isomerase/thioredoxin
MSCFTHGDVLANGSILFTKERFEQIKQKRLGQKWLTLLWSVDCPPCMKELALVQKLQKNQKKLTVLLINTDTEESSDKERVEIIKHFGLTNLESLHFSDGQESQQRYQVDPQWFGELPRSYFINEQGVFHGKSGLIPETLLTQWLMPSLEN